MLYTVNTKKNASPKLINKVEELSVLNSIPEIIKQNSIFTLMKVGSIKQKAKILKKLLEEEKNERFIIDALLQLDIKKEENPKLLMEIIRDFLNKKEINTANDLICSHVSDLYYKIITFSDSSNDQTIEDTEAEKIDLKLAKFISKYHFFSDLIKSVLRNAELVWSHKELFSRKVDKSTMIIEYTKAIDIFLQQKIANYILQNSEILIKKMQSQIIIMEFNEHISDTYEIIHKLDLQDYFGESEFPLHKMQMICHNILNGKIIKNHFRVLDGLRAWSLMIILFARKYSYKGSKFNPLISDHKISNKNTLQLAKSLNSLQEIRNKVIHHAVIVEEERLGRIRTMSFDALNKLFNII